MLFSLKVLSKNMLITKYSEESLISELQHSFSSLLPDLQCYFITSKVDQTNVYTTYYAGVILHSFILLRTF